MAWNSWLSLFGAVSGGIGAVSGYYSFVLSGHRVKCEIGLALRTTGGYVQIDESWTGGFGLGMDYLPNSESMFVQVWNSGRMPIDVKRLVIKNYRRKGEHSEPMGYQGFYAPLEGGHLPHRLEFGSSCSFLIPLDEVNALSKLTIQNKKPRRIYLDIQLGDMDTIHSKNHLTPEQLETFMKQWTEYQQREFPGFSSNS